MRSEPKTNFGSLGGERTVITFIPIVTERIPTRGRYQKTLRLLVGLSSSSRPRRFCITKLFLPHKKKPAENRRAKQTTQQTQHGRRHNDAKNREYARRRDATSPKKPEADTRPERTARHNTDGNGNAREPQSKQPAGKPARRHQAQATRRRDNTAGGNSNSSTSPQDNARAEPGTNDEAPPEHHGRNGHDDEHDETGSPGARNQTATTHAQRGRKTPEKPAHTAEHLRRKKTTTTSPEDDNAARGTQNISAERIGHDAARSRQAFRLNCFSFDRTRRRDGCGDGTIFSPLRRRVTMGDPCGNYYGCRLASRMDAATERHTKLSKPRMAQRPARRRPLLPTGDFR